MPCRIQVRQPPTHALGLAKDAPLLHRLQHAAVADHHKLLVPARVDPGRVRGEIGSPIAKDRAYFVAQRLGRHRSGERCGRRPVERHPVLMQHPAYHARVVVIGKLHLHRPIIEIPVAQRPLAQIVQVLHRNVRAFQVLRPGSRPGIEPRRKRLQLRHLVRG